MADAPRPSNEPVSVTDNDPLDAEAVAADRRDPHANIQSDQPGGADVNPNAEGRFGTLKHNLTNQWKVQVR